MVTAMMGVQPAAGAGDFSAGESGAGGRQLSHDASELSGMQLKFLHTTRAEAGPGHTVERGTRP